MPFPFPLFLADSETDGWLGPPVVVAVLRLLPVLVGALLPFPLEIEGSARNRPPMPTLFLRVWGVDITG